MVGFTTLNEVLRANANGYYIFQRDTAAANLGSGDIIDATHNNITDGNNNAANLKHIFSKKNGLYKGFPIQLAGQVENDKTDANMYDDTHYYGKSFQAGNVYAKDAIDNFCSSFGTKVDG